MNPSFKAHYSSLRNFVKKAKREEKLTWLVILLLVIVLPLTLFVITQSTELRKRADEPISIPITVPPVCATPPVCENTQFLSVNINPTSGCAEYNCVPVPSPTTNPPVCVTPPTCGEGYTLSIEPSPTNGCAAYTCKPNTPTNTPILSCTGRRVGRQADFNNNDRVDLNDYSIFLSEVLKTLPAYTADANCDNRVDLNDYTILLNELLK